MSSVSNLDMRVLVTAIGLLCFAWPESVFACGIATKLLNPTVEEYRQWLETYDGVVFVGKMLRVENPENTLVRTLIGEPGMWVTYKVER